MKLKTGLLILAAAILSTFVSIEISAKPAAGGVTLKEFLGRWDLTLNAPDRQYPSWLELTEENGRLKAQYVGRWGNARPLPKAEFLKGHIIFVSPKEEEDSKVDLTFDGTLTGKNLSGTVNGPDGKTWQWTGVPAPALKRSSEPKWGKPIDLFNGKDLTGWRSLDPKATKTWKVEDGSLVTPGIGPELLYDGKFEDFKLHVEFNCGENSNSGIYLRGRYEVQVETDSLDEPPSHRMGGVYGFLAADPAQPRKPGEWQTYDITLVGRTITVLQNGVKIIDNKEIPGITGGALNSNEGMPGPIYLQGSEKGRVMYRKTVLTPAIK